MKELDFIDEVHTLVVFVMFELLFLLAQLTTHLKTEKVVSF